MSASVVSPSRPRPRPRPRACGSWFGRCGRRLPLAALLAALLAGSGAGAEEPAEWERDASPERFYTSPLDAQGHPTHVVFRVVDDVTGEPLAGATATLREEDSQPLTGLVPAIRTGLADAEGWIRIRADDLGWTPTWLGAVTAYVEAPGHAGLAYSKGTGGEARLARARDVVVEVRDALDRPVAGATIGVHSAGLCGHMPDLREAVTDLEGRAVIPALGFEGGDDDAEGWEAWVSGEGLLGDTHELAIPLFPAPPQLLRHGPSPTIEGTILDAEGQPLAGAYVGTQHRHRGPWTLTNAGGGFRLVGARPAEALLVATTGASGARGPFRIDGVAPPPGVRRVFRLPRGEVAPDPEPSRLVECFFVEAATGKEFEGEPPPVRAVRVSDGLTLEDVANRAKAGLPGGSWLLSIGGGVSPFALRTARVEAAEASPPPVRLEVARAPILRVEFRGDAEAVDVTLVTATEERDLTGEELASGQLHVADGLDAVLRVASGSREEPGGRHLEFVPVPQGRGAESPPLRLQASAPRHLRLRCETPDGRPASAWLTDDLEGWLGAGDLREWGPDTPASPEPEVAVFARGAVDLLVVPEDRALAPRVVTVAIPAAEDDGAAVDGGVVRFAPRGEPRLTVLLPDGRPAPWTSLRVIRGDVVRRATSSETNTLDPFPFTLAPGDLVEVEAWWRDDGAVVGARPVRARLEGAGPWTIRGDLPDTSLVFEPAEAYEGLTIVIDGGERSATPWTDDAGVRHPIEVVGLEPGPHVVAVSAPNRLTRLHRVVLREGERRTLTPRLAPVPGPDAK